MATLSHERALFGPCLSRASMAEEVRNECNSVQCNDSFHIVTLITTRLANEALDWFEDAIGQYMATITSAYEGIPLYTGRLFQQFPGAGKRRIFAICNYMKQRLLNPVHDWAMSVLRTIPMDGAGDQERPINRLRVKEPRDTYCFDLKSATDRWPLSVIYTVFSLFFGPTYASAVVNSALGLNTFLLDYPITKRRYEVSFLAGQPLGYYGSWALFSLSHHFVMWLAAKMAYPNRVTPFKDYAILGDDVLITDGNVASHYREILSKLGVQISGYLIVSQLHHILDALSLLSDLG